MTNTLAKRLTFRIMAVVLVMIAVITGIVYYTVREYMLEEAQERYEGILLRDHEEFRRRLSDVMVASKNNLHDIERDVEAPEKIITHLERILQVNPTVVTCGVLYQPGHFPDRGRCLELYASRDSAGVVHIGNVENDHNDYIDRKWFKECLTKDTADWSDTTYYMPVHREGRPVALLWADLPLEFLKYEIMDDLQEKTRKFEQGCTHHSYNFVIDHEGSYIIHPDEKRILNANFFEEVKSTSTKIDDAVVRSMMKGEHGSAMVEIDGVPSWIYYRTVKHMDWIIAIVVPKEVIFHNGRMLNTIILMIMLIGLVVIYIICRRMINDTTTPVTMQKAALERELKIAHGIQMSMLPKSFPPYPERSDIDIYASVTPAREVGGDLYCYFLRDDCLFFCIGDVSGKGVPAALVMAVTRSLFRSISTVEQTPERIVWRINRAICDGNEANYFVTMFVGILDLNTGRLHYCNAGHEPPLVSGEPLPIKPNLPVGVLSDWKFESQEAQLQPGDMLFLYTDGLSEAKNRAKQQLGRRHVEELVNSHTSDTAQQLVQLMEEEVHRHAGDAEQSDDITLLAIKWQKPVSGDQQVATLSMTASMDEISRLKPYMEQVARLTGLDTKETKRLRLAVEEAVANVINYGEATTITLQTAFAEGRITLTIDDDGLPFDPTDGSTTDLSIPADQRPPGGMGIILLRNMTDSLSYQRLDGHNILTLTKMYYIYK